MQFDFTTLLTNLAQNVHYILAFIAILWIIHFLNVMVGKRLFIFGLIPRHFLGIPGIVCSPFLHGDGNHLFFNSIPLFVLGSFMLLHGVDMFIVISAFIVLVSGILLWTLGRRGLHIGASGLIMGYWGYLLANAYLTQSIEGVIPAVLTLYYFGGMFISIFPGSGGKKTSWDGHLYGCIAGILAAYLQPYLPVIHTGLSSCAGVSGFAC